MAVEPTSLQMRRSRAHAADNHALCRPESACAPADGLGEVEGTIAAFLHDAGLQDDPLGALALRLAQSLDGRVTASAARELRECIVALRASIPDEDDERGIAMLSELKRLVR